MFRTFLCTCAASVLLCSTASALVNPYVYGGGIGTGGYRLGLPAGIGNVHGTHLGMGPPLLQPLAHSYPGINPFPQPGPRLRPTTPMLLPGRLGGWDLPVQLPILIPDPAEPDPVLGWPVPSDVLQGPNTDPAAHMPPIPDGLTVP